MVVYRAITRTQPATGWAYFKRQITVRAKALIIGVPVGLLAVAVADRFPTHPLTRLIDRTFDRLLSALRRPTASNPEDPRRAPVGQSEGAGPQAPATNQGRWVIRPASVLRIRSPTASPPDPERMNHEQRGRASREYQPT